MRHGGPLLGLLSLVALTVVSATLLHGQSTDQALFIDPRGRVGIGTTTPGEALDVVGNAKLSGQRASSALDVSANGTIRGDLSFPRGSGQLLNLGPSGSGIGIQDKTMYFRTVQNFAWYKGGVSKEDKELDPGGGTVQMMIKDGRVAIGGHVPDPETTLDVAGGMKYRGRYQRDDDPETTYEISPRYHLSLTALKYGGVTRTIPQDTLIALCGDPDGCMVRLALTHWTATNTESASVSFLFYYSASDGRWRASNLDEKTPGASGVDGDGTTTHVKNLSEACYFTDAKYGERPNLAYDYQDRGDKEKGMQLLVWNSGGNITYPFRTCELTLID